MSYQNPQRRRPLQIRPAASAAAAWFPPDRPVDILATPRAANRSAPIVLALDRDQAETLGDLIAGALCSAADRSPCRADLETIAIKLGRGCAIASRRPQ